MSGLTENYEQIQVADVALNVGYKWQSLRLTNGYFPEATCEPTATLNINVGMSLDGTPCRPDFDGSTMKILISDGGGADTCLPLLTILSHIGYLAGNVSRNYRFFHASGLVMDGKGVMLVGKTETEKSRLALMLDGDILDDGMLMASADNIRRISRVGFRENPKAVGRDLIRDDCYQSPLDYVFLLDSQGESGNASEVQPSDVDPEITFDDTLHHSLFADYKKRMPIEFQVPIFKIATKSGLAASKNVIEEIVSR